MLRYFTILFIALIVISCNKDEKKPPDNKLQILVTTKPLKDLTENIIGDKADVEILMTAGADPHLFKASENDLEKINNADIIVYNGLHLEGRLEEIFENMKNNVLTFNVSKSIPKDKLIKSDNDHKHESHDHDAHGKEGHDHDTHSHESHDHDAHSQSSSYDPHFWLDVSIYKASAKSFTDFMIKNDGLNKDSYHNNYNNFAIKLDQLQNDIINTIEKLPESNRFLITSHNAYNYFSQAYGIKSIGIQGVSTSHQAVASDISSLAHFIIENKIKAIFYEKGVSQKSVNALKEAVMDKSKDESFTLKTPTLINPGSYNSSYIDMMNENTQIIYEALKNE